MTHNSDFDGAWKRALDLYLKPLLELCFPDAARGIDWSVRPEPLDKELDRINPGAGRRRRRFVDKLVKVRRRDGVEEWVLVHIEVQSQRDRNLPKRMYQYYRRLIDAHEQTAAGVVSLAVLGDLDQRWRPSVYEKELWGCRLRFEYPVAKLVDISSRQRQFNRNLVAELIAAHLAAQATRADMKRRKQLKLEAARRLFKQRFGSKKTMELLGMIHAMMVLPEPLEEEFLRDINRLKGARMRSKRLITPFEEHAMRKGMTKGRQEGMLAMVLRLARKRFAEFGVDEEDKVRQLPLSRVESLGEALLDFAAIGDLRGWLKVNTESSQTRPGAAAPKKSRAQRASAL